MLERSTRHVVADMSETSSQHTTWCSGIRLRDPSPNFLGAEAAARGMISGNLSGALHAPVRSASTTLTVVGRIQPNDLVAFGALARVDFPGQRNLSRRAAALARQNESSVRSGSLVSKAGRRGGAISAFFPTPAYGKETWKLRDESMSRHGSLSRSSVSASRRVPESRSRVNSWKKPQRSANRAQPRPHPRSAMRLLRRPSCPQAPSPRRSSARPSAMT